MYWRRSLVLVFSSVIFGSAVFAQDGYNLWWDVKWYKLKSIGSFDYSSLLGTQRFPLVFEHDWGEGVVYAGEANYLGFEAFLTLELPYPLELEFVVGVDDGAELYLDGEKVIDLWELGRVREASFYKMLGVGKHTLKLRFFEWRGRAYVKFELLGLDKLLLATSMVQLRSKITELEQKLAEAELTAQERIANMLAELETLTRVVARIESMASTAFQSFAENLTCLRAHLVKLEKELADQTQTLSEQIISLRETLNTFEDLLLLFKQMLCTMEENQRALAAETQALEERVSGVEMTLSASTGGWEVHWYEMIEPGVFGKKIGISSFPLNFAYDWGFGRVYKLWDHVGFKAYARILLPTSSWYYIKVAANNCFVLYVDGKKVLDHWGVGEALPAEEKEVELWLSAGWHELELLYYEWEERAWLSFYLN